MIIYKTTNLLNGKIYVGQHDKDNDNYLGSGIYLKRAIKKYGNINFKRETIEYCINQKQLNEREIYWIKKLNSNNTKIGYNIAKGGMGNNGFKQSEETKQKISIKMKKRIREKGNHWIGRQHSEESKRKIGESSKGRKPSEKTKEQIKNKLLWYIYFFINPQGNEIKITSMKGFCKENNLNRQYMRYVMQGKWKQHKGWTFKGKIDLKNVTNNISR